MIIMRVCGEVCDGGLIEYRTPTVSPKPGRPGETGAIDARTVRQIKKS